jgi:NAD(P)-dependent dehydrogenase (short-subunit alcohol dehydrogenase family)
VFQYSALRISTHRKWVGNLYCDRTLKEKQTMFQAVKDKLVFVTGGARRVGRAIALGFAREGAHVIIHHSSSDDAAQATAEEIRALGVKAWVVKGDFRRYDDIAAAFDTIAREAGPIDILVNSASNFESGEFLEVAPESWQMAIDVNLTAPFYCSQHAGRMMRDAGKPGCIINIGDTAGQRPWPHRPQHSVSKAGLLMLTDVTARSLARYNIRCNALVFGPILRTDNLPDATWERVEKRLPLKRSGDPEDAVRACLFVAANDFITGAHINVDGGENLGDATGD